MKKIIDKEICKRAATDEAGLKAYFEKHRSDYQWEERRYRGIVLHGVSKRVVKQARKFLKSLPEEEWKDAIRLTFNAGAQPQIQAEQGVFAPGDNAYVDDLVFKGKDATPLNNLFGAFNSSCLWIMQGTARSWRANTVSGIGWQLPLP